MAQLEYDLVKSLFGRTRAVADLLGLHQAEARAESSPHDVDEAPSQPTLPQEASLGDGVLEQRLDARRIGTPAWNPARPTDPAAPTLGESSSQPEMATPQPVIIRSPPPHAGQFRVPSSAPRAQFRSPPQGLPPVSLPADDDVRLVPDAPPARSGRAGRRFLATFAMLALAGVAAARVYGKLPRPWNTQTTAAVPAPVAVPPPPPPPTPAEQAAARLKVTLADIETMLADGPTFEQLPALEARLAAARKDGGADAAAKLAARAQETLIKAAAAELDKDEIETGVAHYKAALDLDAPEKGRPALAEALRGHAMSALTDRKDPALAVRWARECVAFDNNDVTHALLADMLYAAHEFKDSVDEYRLAIAGRPDDPTLKRGLDRARKKVVSDKPARPRAKARSAKAAPEDEAPAEGGDDTAKTAAPSAPAEPAADEQ
jgi:hypothetical protein